MRCNLQWMEKHIFVLFGFNDVCNRGQMLRLLKDMSHEDIQVLALASIVFLELIWWAVADGWVPKKGRWPQLHKLVQFFLLLFEVEAKALLLVLTVLELSKVDSKVVLFKLVLTPKPDLVELLRVIAPLFPDDVVRLLYVRRLDHFTVFVDELHRVLLRAWTTRVAIRYERVGAFCISALVRFRFLEVFKLHFVVWRCKALPSWGRVLPRVGVFVKPFNRVVVGHPVTVVVSSCAQLRVLLGGFLASETFANRRTLVFLMVEDRVRQLVEEPSIFALFDFFDPFDQVKEFAATSLWLLLRHF